MSKKKGAHHHHGKKERDRRGVPVPKKSPSAAQESGKLLEIVLKCDTSGCVEAVSNAISALDLPEVGISLISSGVGAVTKTDIFMAETGSRLIVGFNVGIAPHIDQSASEHNVEIRLYEVIYKLLDDLEAIAQSFLPRESGEEITGNARIIALFKSSRKGIIIGCEVQKGKLALGNSFRILGAMGQVYTGKIESLHIGKDAVTEAVKGQQVGLKILDFKKVAIGDLVESYRSESVKYAKPWQPQGKILYP